MPIQIPVEPRVPVQIFGDNGVSVSTVNGVLTLSIDLSAAPAMPPAVTDGVIPVDSPSTGTVYGYPLASILSAIAAAAGSGAAAMAALAAEIARAEAAEGVNASALAAEVTRAEGAEGANATAAATNATAISNEATRAKAAEALLAPLASPALTGTPTAPTPPADDDSGRLATTAFLQGLLAGVAMLASPAFTGTPTAPTPPANDASTRIATMAAIGPATSAYIAGQGLALRKSLNIFTVSIADYCNIGATADHTNAINAAVAAVSAVGSGCVIFPDGFDYFVSSAIRLPGAQAVNIKLKCEGRGARLRRVKGYTGNIFFYDGSTQSNCRITIEDFFFFSDYSADTAPKAAAILMQNGNCLQIDILNCLFWDQYAAIDLNAMSEFRITGCRVFHSAGAVAVGFGGYSGLFFTGHCFSGWVSDCRIEGQSPGNPNNLKHCILIQGADGIQFDNIYVWGYFGVHIVGGQGYGIDDLYFTNVVADDCNSRSVLIEGNNSPNAFTNISFTRLHANVHNGAIAANGASSAIVVQGDADNVTFTDVNCGLADGAGVYISGPANNWNGKTKADIHLNAVVCYDNNQANTANTHGIFVDAPGVHIHGGSSKNQASNGHQGYGVAATANAQQLTIVGMDCRGNVQSSGIYIDSGASGTAINVANRTS